MENKNKLINEKSKLKPKLYILSIIAIAAIVFYMNYSGVFAASTNFDKSYNELAKLVRQITSFMVGVSIISGFGTIIFHLMRLGASGGNSQARAKVLQDMFTTIICLALLGSFNMIVYFVVAFMNTK